MDQRQISFLGGHREARASLFTIQEVNPSPIKTSACKLSRICQPRTHLLETYIWRRSRCAHVAAGQSWCSDLGPVRHMCCPAVCIFLHGSAFLLIFNIFSRSELPFFGRDPDAKLPPSLKLSARLVPLPRDGSFQCSRPFHGSGCVPSPLEPATTPGPRKTKKPHQNFHFSLRQASQAAAVIVLYPRHSRCSWHVWALFIHCIIPFS